jgi:hypothetical protein
MTTNGKAGGEPEFRNLCVAPSRGRVGGGPSPQPKMSLMKGGGENDNVLILYPHAEAMAFFEQARNPADGRILLACSIDNSREWLLVSPSEDERGFKLRELRHRLPHIHIPLREENGSPTVVRRVGLSHAAAPTPPLAKFSESHGGWMFRINGLVGSCCIRVALGCGAFDGRLRRILLQKSIETSHEA